MVTENNVISLVGTVTDGPDYSHNARNENFYKIFVSTPRLSGTNDILPVTISEKLTTEWLCKGAKVKITGQLRSYNKKTESGYHLILTVFVKEIALAEDKEVESANEIYLNGYICKPCLYRKTPSGREITDLFIAVNRAFNRSDYIPAIAWGRNAVLAARLKIGANIQIWGRLQSREYVKHISDTEGEPRTVYEVSIVRMDEIFSQDAPSE